MSAGPCNMGAVSEHTLARSASTGRVQKSHMTLDDGLWGLLANCLGKPRSFACSPSWTIGPSFTNTRGMFQPLPLGQNCGSKNCDSYEHVLSSTSVYSPVPFCLWRHVTKERGNRIPKLESLRPIIELILIVPGAQQGLKAWDFAEVVCPPLSWQVCRLSLRRFPGLDVPQGGTGEGLADICLQ